MIGALVIEGSAPDGSLGNPEGALVSDGSAPGTPADGGRGMCCAVGIASGGRAVEERDADGTSSGDGLTVGPKDGSCEGGADELSEGTGSALIDSEGGGLVASDGKGVNVGMMGTEIVTTGDCAGEVAVGHPAGIELTSDATPGCERSVRRRTTDESGVHSQHGSPSSSPLVRPSPSESIAHSSRVHAKLAAAKSRPNWLRGEPSSQSECPRNRHVIPEPARSQASPFGIRARKCSKVEHRANKRQKQKADTRWVGVRPMFLRMRWACDGKKRNVNGDK